MYRDQGQQLLCQGEDPPQVCQGAGLGSAPELHPPRHHLRLPGQLPSESPEYMLRHANNLCRASTVAHWCFS